MYYQFNPELVSEADQPLVKSLLDCKNFEGSERLSGYAKGRGITWFLNTQAELGVESVLRHYYRGGLFGKLIKDHYLFVGVERTRAAKEFHLLKQMYDWGLPVPRPIAFKIASRFGCYQADILLEKFTNTQDLSQYLQTKRLTEGEYRAIGALIRRLHDRQVHHSDLNIHNILREKQNGTFYLIDFDKCQIQQGEAWKSANLARLLRSFRKERGQCGLMFNDDDWEQLLKGYQKVGI